MGHISALKAFQPHVATWWRSDCARSLPERGAGLSDTKNFAVLKLGRAADRPATLSDWRTRADASMLSAGAPELPPWRAARKAGPGGRHRPIPNNRKTLTHSLSGCRGMCSRERDLARVQRVYCRPYAGSQIAAWWDGRSAALQQVTCKSCTRTAGSARKSKVSQGMYILLEETCCLAVPHYSTLTSLSKITFFAECRRPRAIGAGSA